MDASTNTPRIRKQPKLRASCDACGASKLKCDRGQPECERCVSHGIPCVYGVSRKMGKPRRDRQQSQSIVAATMDCDGKSGSASGRAPSRGFAMSEVVVGGATEQPPMGLAGTPTNDSTTTTPSGELNNLDDFGLGVLAGLYRHDGYHHHRPGLPASFPCFDFIDWESIPDHSRAHDAVPLSETGRLLGGGPVSNTQEVDPPDIRSHSSAGDAPSAAQPAAAPQPSALPDASAQEAAAGNTRDGDHDCTPEAYEILKTLSSHDRHPGGDGPVACGLEQVLRLNRKASEQLDRLLACPCAGAPHLALLYGSVISRILEGYKHAAGCALSAQTKTSSPPWSGPTGTASIAAYQPTSNQDSETASASSAASRQGSSPRTFSSTSTRAASVSGQGPSPAAASAGAGLPVRMAIGTFDVDDLGVQSALKIQLLSGELRRAGRLIDQLAAHYSDASSAVNNNMRQHSSGAYDVTKYFLYHGGGGGGVGSMGLGTGTGANTSSLYQSLDSWLRSEHGRIANMMRMKLIEFNA